MQERYNNFPNILGNSEGSGAKSYMTNDLLISVYGENICSFPHIFGSPSSYTILQTICPDLAPVLKELGHQMDWAFVDMYGQV